MCMKKILLILFASMALVVSCRKEGIYPKSISLDKTELTIGINESEELTVIYEPADVRKKKVKWTSSDASVALVEDGVVYGIAPGPATVTARCGDAEAVCQVNVIKRPVSIQISDVQAERRGARSVYFSCDVKIAHATDENCRIQYYLGPTLSAATYGATPVKTEEVSVSNYSMSSRKVYFSYDIADDKVYQRYYFSIAVVVDDYTAWSTPVSIAYLEMNPVDLGVVVGGKKIYFGDRNLFAKSPEENGEYYQWGCLKSSFGSFSFYDYTDTPATLPYSRDIASQTLGGRWRIPTEAEWKAMISQCEKEAVQSPYGCTVKGNGSSIFLPRAQYYNDGHFASTTYVGCYWSSILDPENKDIYAKALYFSLSFNMSESSVAMSIRTFRRENALPVRPVCD